MPENNRRLYEKTGRNEDRFKLNNQTFVCKSIDFFFNSQVLFGSPNITA